MDEKKENGIRSLVIYLGVINIPFFAFAMLALVEGLLNDAKQALLPLFFLLAMATSFYFSVRKNHTAVWVNIIIILALTFMYFSDGWRAVINEIPAKFN